MQTRQATCHPERKHKAKGLCIQCYERSGRRNNNRVKSKCHPDLPHQARGLCKPCYMKDYLSKYKRPIQSLRRRKEGSWKRDGIGITADEFDSRMIRQGGVCAICKKPPTSKRALAVDHDHSTRIVRGLLCDYCNRRLMIPRNTSEILHRAFLYINGDLKF